MYLFFIPLFIFLVNSNGLAPIDIGPGLYLEYRGQNVSLLIKTTLPSRYSRLPSLIMKIELIIGDTWEEHIGTLYLHNNTFLCSSLPEWRHPPFFIPKRASEVVLFLNSPFRLVNYSYVNYRGEKLLCSVFSNGTNVLYYDSFTGILLEGLVDIRHKRFYIRLERTNLVFRRHEYMLYPDWYALTDYLIHIVNNTKPDMVRVISIGKSVMGRDIWTVEFNYQGTKVLIVEAGIHGSELICVKTAIELIDWLRQGVNGDLGQLLKDSSLCISVIPMLNPDGVERGKASPEGMFVLCARCNARFVDLNRNFPYGWSFFDSELFGTPTYRGPHPASEPETIAVMKYCINKRNIIGYISLHSGAPQRIIIAPAKDGIMDPRVELLALKLAKHVRATIYPSGPHGSSFWWVYRELEVPSVIIEIWGRGETLEFSNYNPDEMLEMLRISHEIRDALIKFILDLYRAGEEVEGQVLYRFIISITILFIIMLAIAIIRRALRRPKHE